MVSCFTPFLLLCVVSTGLFACFCDKMTFYQPGEYDHSVLYTTAQLTEGRSARDQPKQPPFPRSLLPSKSLSIDSLTPWGGPASILNFRPSPALQRKQLTSLHFPVSYTSFRTSSLPPSNLLSSITFVMITSAMTPHALITCNPTIFSPGPPLTL